jgi:hypothetical protein
MVLSGSARAGFIFGKKKPKVDPVLRVPELLGVVKTSTDESQRSDAAEELRKYDPGQFPDIIPTLIDVLQADTKTSVRISAISTLTRFRPVSQAVGQAIEQALAKDPSVRVRLQARSSLLQYHLAGYRTAKKEAPKVVPPPVSTKEPPQTREPPLASPFSSGGNTPYTPNPLPATVPARSQAPRPMPIGPVTPVPSSTPGLSPPPAPRTSEGPDLGSPY